MANEKTISITEFKARCSGLLNEIAHTKTPLILTKRGKPAAMVTPLPASPDKKWNLGQFKGQATITGDIVTPLEEP